MASTLGSNATGTMAGSGAWRGDWGRQGRERDERRKDQLDLHLDMALWLAHDLAHVDSARQRASASSEPKERQQHFHTVALVDDVSNYVAFIARSTHSSPRSKRT
ncbi:hypothetical protein PC9H_011398 [Pleurotus ostreatus]|uniref:Uncharacterized protein n=1 Tax=Pleurotus ostreatus TaxID=5322 RepID=A0A8H7DLF2_PLEOS|nr:uncharacterized protein PC9H_011398 [Pleurotus ostreatus]KAF7420880.1 hypothetical protein PC9H_011398 [Pleurotus ostreatus]